MAGFPEERFQAGLLSFIILIINLKVTDHPLDNLACHCAYTSVSVSPCIVIPNLTTVWHRNTARITGFLWGKPQSQRATNPVLYFFSCKLKWTVEQTIGLSVTGVAMTFMYCHCKTCIVIMWQYYYCSMNIKPMIFTFAALPYMYKAGWNPNRTMLNKAHSTP